MDFFEHQAVARKKTDRMVLLFFLAVFAIMLMVYAAVACFVAVMRGSSRGGSLFDWSILIEPPILLGVGLGTVAVVAVGSLYKMAELRAGGRVIAEALGGRRLDHSTTDPDERKILNVVEEMAIASGIPVPLVFLLDDEAAINAFAAGYSPSDAVIGVTRGAVQLLSRDELQGVMAHEFSHILNGDMRLNLRLIGVIHGILVIGLIGYAIIRSLRHARPSRSSRSKSGGGVLAIILLGVALLIIGYVGVFFANLIKAAVSRQREYLADAAAVQFTRYPDGIAGALKRIGGYTFHSNLVSPHADQASHMFFALGISHFLGSLLSTHPPLPQRILRLDPNWDGVFPSVEPSEADEEKARKKQRKLSRPRAVATLAASASFADRVAAARSAMAAQPQPSAASAFAHLGHPAPEHLDYARQLLAKLPVQLTAAAHEPFAARAVIFALLLDPQPAVRQVQLARLRECIEADLLEQTLTLANLLQTIDPAARLPLIDMTLPALRQLSAQQYALFKQSLAALIHADDRVDLFEWMLQRMTLRHLEPQFSPVKPPRVQYYNLRRLCEPCSVLLSTLAYVGHRDPDAASAAFDQAAAFLHETDLKLCPPQTCSLNALEKALETLVLVAPREKRQLITAAAACISADNQVTVREVELLRAICDSLDCPMPPLLPGQPIL